MDPTLSPQPITDRIIALIAVLSQAVIDRQRVPGMTAAVIGYVTEKLLGIHLRFRAVVARIAAGTTRPETPRKKRARKPKPEVDPHLPRGWRKWLPKDTREKPLWRVLRTGQFAWLCNALPTIPGFRHSAALCGTHLRQLLDDPGMQALLATSRRVGDALRPLCWMLGVEISLLYPAKPAAPSVPAATGCAPSAEWTEDSRQDFCPDRGSAPARPRPDAPVPAADQDGPEPSRAFLIP